MNIGDVIEGRYRVVRKLGEGGMGIVFAARHLQLDQPVALKLLRREALAYEDVAQRFLREARAAVRLKSEHVCRVFDVGSLPTGEHYIAMELLEGDDLDAIVRRDGPLPIATAASYLLQACDALAEAHALGIVHRDLKPANLFVTRHRGAPLVKVLDFGIAKVADVVDGGLTSTHAVMGSPSYMSPEQLRSAKLADARSDIWALGVTLYELVTGRRPFVGETMSALSIAIATEPPEPLGDAPPALVACIGRCLEKRPGDRYADIAAFAAALVPLAGVSGHVAARIERVAHAGVAATEPPDAFDPAPAGAPLESAAPTEAPVPFASESLAPRVTSVDSTTAGDRTPRRRRGLVAAIAVVGAAVLGLVAFSRVDKRTQTQTTVPPIVVPTDAPTEAAVAAPLVPDFRHGTRLRIATYETPEGLAIANAIFDTELKTACVSATAEDGTNRCLPITNRGGDEFLDSACKTPALLEAASCPAPGFIPATTARGVAIYRVGAPRSARTYYRRVDDDCIALEGPRDEVVFPAAAKVPARSFAQMYYGVEPSDGELGVRILGGDGMTFAMALFDTRHRVACERDLEDGVCRPFVVDVQRFADAACTEPVVARARIGNDARLVSRLDPGSSQCEIPRKLAHELEPGDVEVTYAVVGGACVKQPADGAYARVGKVVEAARLPAVTEVIEPAAARLTRRWLADRAGNRLLAVGFYDQERKAPCHPARTSDGMLRCAPPLDRGRIVYTDQTCTRPVARFFEVGGCPVTPPPSEVIGFVGTPCPGAAVRVRVYRVGAKLAGARTICLSGPDGCSCDATAADGELHEVTEVPPAELAPLEHRMP